MSSSRDLSLASRISLSVLLVTLAWAVPRTPAIRAGGGTAVPLSAGLAALVTLLALRVPLRLWPDAGRRAIPDVRKGAALAAIVAACLLAGGNAVRTRHLWHGDVAAVVALLAGAAVWGAVVAASTQRSAWRWYLVAAGVALLPEAVHIGILRPDVAAGPVVAASLYFLAADALVLLVTEELAFRRALCGPPESAGLGALALMAVAFGLWHAVQPGYTGSPVWIFVGTSLGGFVTGCLYALSGSLLVAAAYHALHNAPLKALSGAPVVPGLAGLAGAATLALTAALALGLGWLVYRRGGAAGTRLS
ncbi:MAG: CPBP family intramembrane metalloprotease [Gemmatimonadetes bacterium]|nr:CPBP family intramembrane metalloprotease [Gemmatimonadota bacterium]